MATKNKKTKAVKVAPRSAKDIYNDMIKATNQGDSGINYGVKGSEHTWYKMANNEIGNEGLHNNELTPDLVNLALHSGIPDKEVASKMFSSFSKFGYLDHYNRMPNTKEVLFFTRPDLHIVNPSTGQLQPELDKVPFFMDLLEMHPEVVHDLQRSWGRTSNNNNFMASLHNRVKDTLELPDISSTDIDIPTNMHGNNYEYRGSSEASDDGHSFSLEFEDNRYLDIYMMFKAYDEYERMKRLGRVTPDIKYIRDKILHDQISIYKFVLSDDFSTIIHYSKFIGCFPTGLPRSAFNTNDFQNGLSLSINWKCAFVEDMNPLILGDFNIAMSAYKPAKYGGKHNIISNISPDGAHINRKWANGAYIDTFKYEGNDREFYRLLWMD